MKKQTTTLLLTCLLLLTSLSSTLTDQPITLIDELEKPIDTTPKPQANPWNETIIISPTWQELIGTFFGYNLKQIPTLNISVRETLVLISIFIMLLALIKDILKLTPLFQKQIGPISTNFLTALIITTLISISGALLNLKDLFLNLTQQITQTLQLDFLFSRSLITGAIVLATFFLLFIILDFIKPLIEKYSKISRSEAIGRKMRNQSNEDPTPQHEASYLL